MLNQMRRNCVNCFRAGVDSDEEHGGARGRRTTVQQASSSTNEDDDLERGLPDQYLLSDDLDDHLFGKFSSARTVVQKNHEVYGIVESENDYTLVGIFDGHHGNTTSKFLSKNLFEYTTNSVARSGGTISETVLFDVIERTDDIFLNSMRVVCDLQIPDSVNGSSFATVGSSCLIGLIYDKKLFVANLGDSRAVMCSLDALSQPCIRQLTPEDSLRINAVKEQMLELNPDDAQDIVRRKMVKGKVSTTKSIGDLYLKDLSYSALPETNDRFQFRTPLRRPALSAEPYVTTIALDENVKFVIFGSYGIWKFLTHERAVQLVTTKPQKGIAKRLIGEALDEAGMRGNPPRTYEVLKIFPSSDRIKYQIMDMMVIVIYFDKDGILGVERGTGQLSDAASMNTSQSTALDGGALDGGANVASS